MFTSVGACSSESTKLILHDDVKSFISQHHLCFLFDTENESKQQQQQEIRRTSTDLNKFQLYNCSVLPTAPESTPTGSARSCSQPPAVSRPKTATLAQQKQQQPNCCLSSTHWVSFEDYYQLWNRIATSSHDVIGQYGTPPIRIGDELINDTLNVFLSFSYPFTPFPFPPSLPSTGLPFLFSSLSLSWPRSGTFSTPYPLVIDDL